MRIAGALLEECTDDEDEDEARRRMMMRMRGACLRARVLGCEAAGHATGYTYIVEA